MISLTEQPYTVTLKESLAQPVSQPREVNLWWLGQAGFALKYAETLLLIDPYLSDFLAKKYQGKEFPHIRMMDAPIRPEELEQVRVVCCTHRHSDHLDPETVLPIAQNNPDCLFVMPGLNWHGARNSDCLRLRFAPSTRGKPSFWRMTS